MKLDSLHCCIGDNNCYILSKQMLYVTIYVVDKTYVIFLRHTVLSNKDLEFLIDAKAGPLVRMQSEP